MSAAPAVAENIIAFARALRAAGLKLGPGSAVDAVEAVETAGFSTRDDFYWTLHAVLVKRHEDDPVFDSAFRLFWRHRDPNEAILTEMRRRCRSKKRASAACRKRCKRRA
jgi:uncharacterized protein